MRSIIDAIFTPHGVLGIMSLAVGLAIAVPMLIASNQCHQETAKLSDPQVLMDPQASKEQMQRVEAVCGVASAIVEP